jgi:hypothetical protein
MGFFENKIKIILLIGGVCEGLFYTTVAEYFPLTTDRIWVYKVTKGENFGDTLFLTDTTYIETCKVVPTMKGGISAYLYSTKEGNIYYVKKRSEIIEFHWEVEQIFDTVLPCTLIKFPLKGGNEWWYLFYPESEIGFIKVVADTMEDVTTKAGNFNCVKLSFYRYDNEVGRRVWFAEGVGIVKEEFPRWWCRRELIFYK